MVVQMVSISIYDTVIKLFSNQSTPFIFWVKYITTPSGLPDKVWANVFEGFLVFHKKIIYSLAEVFVGDFCFFVLF